jgi:hypothetical protein
VVYLLHGYHIRLVEFHFPRDQGPSEPPLQGIRRSRAIEVGCVGVGVFIGQNVVRHYAQRPLSGAFQISGFLRRWHGRGAEGQTEECEAEERKCIYTRNIQ